jgi:hypothetical protein
MTTDNHSPPLGQHSPSGQDAPAGNHLAVPEFAGRRRSGSGSSILSRIPFIRSSESKSNMKESRHVDGLEDASHKSPRALSAAFAEQQQKPRRRKGSLRKVALLGRGGAARDRREMKPEIKSILVDPATPVVQSPLQPATDVLPPTLARKDVYGLGISDITPRPSMDGFARPPEPPVAFPSMSDSHIPLVGSTTDDEDVLSIPIKNPSPLRLSSLSSSSDSFFPTQPAPSLPMPRRKSTLKRAKSPLALQGLATSTLPAPDEEHDYGETEWWGWVVLVVTWFVFIIGMGSVLNIWSWVWDVGTTPYAPPELENDPTLPIVGYYPALIILTCIMAWVWVVVAWVGMKYFRHAKIAGD